ncbi:eyespot assembly protein, ABC1 kinase family [Haematococcus lacustris]|uniref:Eyespot assembly protein, ABC1 kinase family n=1 Tax=Haematococcus lacustris TaxID=44745 RepID=A0A699YHP4_HAELA|nr:eyespot assembly protein, ABC1 kinase family [Haematococcus lacustris]
MYRRVTTILARSIDSAPSPLKQHVFCKRRGGLVITTDAFCTHRALHVKAGTNKRSLPTASPDQLNMGLQVPLSLGAGHTMQGPGPASCHSFNAVGGSLNEPQLRRCCQHGDGASAQSSERRTRRPANTGTSAQCTGLPDLQPGIEWGTTYWQSVADTANVAGSLPFSEIASVASVQYSNGIDSLEGLTSWASQHLSAVHAVDPDMHSSLQHSLASLTGALQSTLTDYAISSQASPVPWTNALVLGVQQLVTTLYAPGAGHASIEAMVAAQEAMQLTLASAAAEASGLVRAAGLLGNGAVLGEMPAGLAGLMQFAMALVALLVASVPRNAASANTTDVDALPLRYDPAALRSYYSKHPVMVLQRNSEVVSQLVTFCVAILADWRLGKWEANMPARAQWSREIIQAMGPAFIKIAQMVSTRVDIMPEVYLKEFSVLQDKVATFSTVEARIVLEEGLGCPVDSVFEWLSEEPIAAASLGQVYRGMLRPEWGGCERPGALERVSLDIHIMRQAAQLFSQLPGMSDSWALALDDWAVRFFQEMDYQLEAHNTISFKQSIAGLQGVRVATVHQELTSRKVIVTEWIEASGGVSPQRAPGGRGMAGQPGDRASLGTSITKLPSPAPPCQAAPGEVRASGFACAGLHWLQGERLADSTASDVKALCSTLLNCYLIQLLETGLLHADPHPGNLMRTADGKIVILDFGLITEVSEDQRIALVEFIAHLTVEDWEGVALDLVKLGFMPDGMPPEILPHIAPVMEKVMGQLVKGGGLRNGISVTGIAAELSGAALNYKLCVPPYFALVVRAFCVIEGIALKVDPNYAIVQECMPYMSRRLLSDNNPRMRAALRQLLYGTGSRLDVARLSRMVSSFSSFTTAGAEAEPAAGLLGDGSAQAQAAEHGSVLGSLLHGGPEEQGPVLNDALKDMLKLVFSKDGNYAQEILVEEAVAAVDAMSREAIGEALRLVAGTATSLAALRGMEALGPLRAMLMPLPLPVEAVAAVDALSREAIGEALRLVAGTATSLAALRGVEALGPLRAMLMPLPLPVARRCHGHHTDPSVHDPTPALPVCIRLTCSTILAPSSTSTILVILLVLL